MFEGAKNYLEYMEEGIEISTFEPSKENRDDEDEDGDNVFHILIFEYCNMGTLEGVEKYFAKLEEICPEGFIWGAVADIVEGLTCLNGEHLE
ncbi:hypothetical protein ACMFMG_003025 [Clarireedia jacksonii]